MRHVLAATGDPLVDTPALNAAVNQHDHLELQGFFNTNAPLVITAHHRLIEGKFTISSSAPTAIVSSVSVLDMRGGTIWSAGLGWYVLDGSSVRLDTVKINSARDAMRFERGAGLWLRACHLNCTEPGNGQVGLRFAGTWDSAWISDTLFEGYNCGIRWGGPAGHQSNFWLSGVVIDACQVGFLIEPSGAGSVSNIQMSNLWAAGHFQGGGIVPGCIDGRSTSGWVGHVLVSNAYFTNFPNKAIWQVGQLGPVDLVNVRHA